MRDEEEHTCEVREVGVKAWKNLEIGMEEPIPRNKEHMSILNLDQINEPINKLHLTQTWSSLKEVNWPSG